MTTTVDGLRDNLPDMHEITNLPDSLEALSWVIENEPDLTIQAEDLVVAVHRRMVERWIGLGELLGYVPENLRMEYERCVSQFVPYDLLDQFEAEEWDQ